MLDLEKFGLVELDAQEVNEIEGGLFWIIAIAVAIVAIDVYDAWHGQNGYGHP